jgi:hypothetical protein
MTRRELGRRFRAARAAASLSENDVRHLRYLTTVTMRGGHAKRHCACCARLKDAAERMGACDG